MSYNYLPLDSKWLHFKQIKNLLNFNQLVSITFTAHEQIIACRDYLEQKLNSSHSLHHDINTGFGSLQYTEIDASQIEQLQHNILQANAYGFGEEVPKNIVKLMLMLKIKSLSHGFSGVQIDTVKRLIDMYNNDVLPIIYTQSFLSVPGDVTPLSHLSLPLIGLGEVYYNDHKMTAEQAYKQLNWQPITLQSKEGLALINGTQFMSAFGIYCLKKSEQLIAMADLITAMSMDAFGCSVEPLHPLIQQIRPHKGQVETAKQILSYLKNSQLAKQEKTVSQDPYSFTCMPQIHGATKDAYQYVLSIFMQEVNIVTDHPTIFPEEDTILSGGNFNGQPLALALDFLCMAMSELASISERRIHQLISGQRGLPMFLVKEAGLNSGFTILHNTAAFIVNENKQLCTPASLDSISSSNHQEDYISMGANAATKCLKVVNNVEKVLAIELMSATQALDCRRPSTSSEAVENLFYYCRNIVSFNEKDTVQQVDIMAAIDVVAKYNVLPY